MLTRTPVRIGGRWLAAVAFALGAITATVGAVPTDVPPKSAVSTNISDIWWNSGEPGWGMQLVQTGTYAFATLYLYGPGGSAMFVTAELKLGPGLAFSGPLYLSSGSYFAGPYDPAAFKYRQAGTMTFVLTSVDTGLLTYSIDGRIVQKTVSREPLTLDDYNGTFAFVSVGTASACSDPADNGTTVGALAMEIVQNGTAMHITMLDPMSYVTCEAEGAFSQNGRAGRFSGPFSCDTGPGGTLEMSEMNINVGRINGRIAMTSTFSGCQFQGNFVGLTP